MTQLTVSVLGAAVMGVDTGPYSDALFRTLPALGEALNARVMVGLPLPLSIPTRANRDLLRVKNELFQTVEAIIAARRSTDPPEARVHPVRRRRAHVKPSQLKSGHRSSLGPAGLWVLACCGPPKSCAGSLRRMRGFWRALVGRSGRRQRTFSVRPRAR